MFIWVLSMNSIYAAGNWRPEESCTCRVAAAQAKEGNAQHLSPHMLGHAAERIHDDVFSHTETH